MPHTLLEGIRENLDDKYAHSNSTHQREVYLQFSYRLKSP